MHTSCTIIPLKQKLCTYTEHFVGVCDECNEHAKHHVDEEGNEEVDVDLAEDPESLGCL